MNLRRGDVNLDQMSVLLNILLEHILLKKNCYLEQMSARADAYLCLEQIFYLEHMSA